MISFLIFIILPFQGQSQETVQDVIQEVKKSYLFTLYSDNRLKKYNSRVSPCFKINKMSKRVLTSQYENCQTTPKGQLEPLQRSIGECTKKQKTKALFFKSLNECKSARREVIRGARI